MDINIYLCVVQRITAILLIFSLGFQCLLKLGIVAWYEVNKDYVAEYLCINKDKPEMKCEGKCYLCKQLNKTEDGSGQNKQLPSKDNRDISIVFITQKKIVVPLVFSIYQRIYYPYYQKRHNYLPVTDIFHPPGLFVC